MSVYIELLCKYDSSLRKKIPFDKNVLFRPEENRLQIELNDDIINIYFADRVEVTALINKIRNAIVNVRNEEE